jgi:hypothetical protein
MDGIRGPGMAAAEAIGKRFGEWEVLHRIPMAERCKPNCSVLALCHGCGVVHEAVLSNLITGKSTRCKRCACRANRLSNPHNTNAMIVGGAIKHLPKLGDEQLDRLLQAVLAERDGRAF